MTQLDALVADPTTSSEVESVWNAVSKEFDRVNKRKFHRYMERREVSFHTHIKLLGYLAHSLRDLPGDIVEIGVWKGKSLTLMQRLAGPSTRVIGIDPLELEGQEQELAIFQKIIFPTATIIKGYSEEAVERVTDVSKTFKLLHIDGGHYTRNVWLDFLIYERFVVPGGFLVFDDYTDATFCPEVGPAIDKLRDSGLFSNFQIIGQVEPYTQSFVLRRPIK